MAEAVAIISLCSSIVQLIDFGSKLSQRLNDFIASTEDVPKTFRNISVQLPAAILALQRLRGQVERDELGESESATLRPLIYRSFSLVTEMAEILEKVVPSKTSSSFKRWRLAIQSLRHDKHIEDAGAQLLSNIRVLTFFQTSRIQDNATSSNKTLSGTANSADAYEANFLHGLNLGGAPLLASGNFVGRDSELQQLAKLLDAESPRQAVVSVVGMGGVGKTQLCIEYALRHQEKYTSIFWLNAQDETSFRADLLKVADSILPDRTSELSASEDNLVKAFRQWLSRPDNQKWLLILDNYDTPKIPGISDPTAFDIRDYFPFRSQGSILITTRSREITFAKQVPLQTFKSVNQGLEVLAARSGRTFEDDPDAIDLVQKLDGLPLALASAASFLERTSCTVKEYINEHERIWSSEESYDLFEYGARTLFTTWNLSLERLKTQSPESAELLRILAFFGNENIDYNLLSAQTPIVWSGLEDSVRTEATFHMSMGKLRDYSLVETSHRSYRLHPCLHDWTLLKVNRNIEEQDVWHALHCIMLAVESSNSFWSVNHDEPWSQLAPHTLRLTQPLLFDVLMKSNLNESRSYGLCELGELLHQAKKNDEARQVVNRSLSWALENLGPDHVHALAAFNALGMIERSLQNLEESENLLKKAISGLERTHGRYDKNTLNSVHNLALLYMQLERLEEAEHMYLWSLRGCEESYGVEDPNYLWAVMALGNFYVAKGDLSRAEAELHRALAGFDAVISTDHSFARRTAARLAAIYQKQGEFYSALALYQRVYQSCQRVFGLSHTNTREAENNLILCEAQFRSGQTPDPDTPSEGSIQLDMVKDIKSQNRYAVKMVSDRLTLEDSLESRPHYETELSEQDMEEVD